jgi:hypothetical protein
VRLGAGVGVDSNRGAGLCVATATRTTGTAARSGAEVARVTRRGALRRKSCSGATAANGRIGTGVGRTGGLSLCAGNGSSATGPAGPPTTLVPTRPVYMRQVAPTA